MSGTARAQGDPPAGGGGAALPPGVVAAMLLLCAAWGLNVVAMKIGGEGIPPVLQAGLRSVVAAPLLFAWCRWRGVDLGGLRRTAPCSAGAALGAVFALEFLFLYLGLGLTTASRGVVFLYTAPFFVAIGAHFLLPGDRLDAGQGRRPRRRLRRGRPRLRGWPVGAGSDGRRHLAARRRHVPPRRRPVGGHRS